MLKPTSPKIQKLTNSFIYHFPFLSGDPDWTTVATGVTDCYYNVTDLPTGSTLRFRVTCSNKAGQGPSSNCSGPVSLDPAGISGTE